MWYCSFKMLVHPSVLLYGVTEELLEQAYTAHPAVLGWIKGAGVVGWIIGLDVESRAEFEEAFSQVIEEVNSTLLSMAVAEGWGQGLIVWSDPYSPEFAKHFGNQTLNILLTDLRNDIELTKNTAQQN